MAKKGLNCPICGGKGKIDKSLGNNGIMAKCVRCYYSWHDKGVFTNLTKKKKLAKIDP